jgi:MoaA/NifB/PqqE/SkfB family radical SAM enzyme
MLRKAYLEITNVCNLRCAFCPGTARTPRFMTPEDFRLLAGKLRGHTEYLYFHLMGEPLLHPGLETLLAIADELRFKVMLTSNGTLLPQRQEVLLAAPALHKVNISLQSFEANGGGELSSYLRGCTDFASTAAKAGKLCEFRLWNRGGWESMNPAIRAALAAVFPEPWESSRNGFRLAERIWLEPGDRFDWPDLSLPSLGERCFCYGLRDQVGVLVDGTVVPCCLDHEGDLPLGNLFGQELEDIMSTDKARMIYRGFSRKTAVAPLCRRCGYARRFT